MTAVEYFAIGLAVFIAAVYVYGCRPIQRFRLRHIPGPPPKWLVGNFLDLQEKGGHVTDVIWAKEYGPVFRMILGAHGVVSVGDAQLARKVLLHSAHRQNVLETSALPYDTLASAQSSILWESGGRWRGLRAAWQPMFFTGSLRGYFKDMKESIELLMEEIGEHATEGHAFDIYAAMGDMTLDIVSRAAFGLDLKIQKKADRSTSSPEEERRAKRVREAAVNLFSHLNDSPWDMLGGVAPFLLPVLRRLAHRFPDKNLQRQLHARQAIGQVVEELFADHRASLAAAAGTDSGIPNGKENGHSLGNGYKPLDSLTTDKTQNGSLNLRNGVQTGSFIDLLVRGSDRETGEAFPDTVMAQQAVAVLVAGFETTGITLGYACYLLARSCNAEKQAALAAEVDAFGRDTKPTYEDLERFPYMDAVIKETLRLFPPIVVALHVLQQDMDLGGYKLKAGQRMAVPIHAIQNNPKIWPDADVFMPERWLEGHPQQKNQPAHAYLAFGLGPRQCVGGKFAYEEMRLALVRLYQKYTLELAPGQEPLEVKDAVIMSPKSGVFVKAIPRL